MYKKLVYWELEINETEGKSMAEVLNNQKEEANTYFGRFIIENYEDWVTGQDKSAPLMSHQLFKEKVFPLLKQTGDTPVYFVLIDNLRYDQWKNPGADYRRAIHRGLPRSCTTAFCPLPRPTPATPFSRA